MKRLPRTVVALGVVSLLTDASSEMIIPILPAFLVSLGASGAFVGAVDGVAETTSSLMKLIAGAWADRAARKKPLVLLGYGLASIMRPLVAIAQAPWHVLVIRFTDRIGKGVRTAPRDALIAQATPADRRGAAYGFHRAMDHTGALIGPLIAYVLLAWLPPRAIFALAAIPAAASLVALALFVKEEAAPRPAAPPVAGAARPRLPRRLWAYLAVIVVFTLGNSTDFFLLLRAQDAGIDATLTPLLWSLLHLSKASLSTPLGALSDRVGRRGLLFFGWGVYALVYLGFAAATAPWHIWALFAVYGVYFAATEGVEKALIADLAPPEVRGRAFGVYHFLVGVCALPASIGFGVVWDRVSHGAAFACGAALAGAAALGLALVPGPKRS
ncbi:MAG TPA: MFS transporter [Haliangiales bacterium]|nr:MFS transporter [Haliangiales bacterium]